MRSTQADVRARSTLLGVLVSAQDWPAVESQASDMLRSDPRDVEAWYSLGYALFRLDRNREALARCQRAILDDAGGTEFGHWRSTLRELAELLDQDGPHDPNDDLARNEARFVRMPAT